jgi:hypothetical protein
MKEKYGPTVKVDVASPEAGSNRSWVTTFNNAALQSFGRGPQTE